jgi:hypothetical protein
MKAFLIHCPESFAWNDLSINRKKYIEDFIDVHDYASEQDDTIYSNAEIWELKIGDFFFLRNTLLGRHNYKSKVTLDKSPNANPAC